MSGARPRVVWAYEREHELHPFIVMGLNTLVNAGWDAAIVTADKAAGKPYQVFDDFCFDRRIKNWINVTRTLNDRIKERESTAHKKVLNSKKHLDGLYGKLSLRETTRFRVRALVYSVVRTVHWSHRTSLHRFAIIRNATIDTWAPYVRGLFRMLRLEADVVIASRPQAAVWVAMIAKLRGQRFVYFPFELYGEQITKPSGAVLALERFMLKFLADAVVTQNESRARIYVEERGARVTPLIVHNYKVARSAHPQGGRLRARHDIPPDRRIVLYEGLLIEGRWLEHLAQAVFHLPEDTVIVMMGQEKLKWLSSRARDLEAAKATGRLILAPPAPHDELPDLIADADVGVIIYDDAVRNNVFCEPGKLTDYITVGVPVVAPNFPTIGPVVRDLGIGLCFEGHSPEAIARAITAVMAKPKAEWRPALDQACSILTWETQEPNLLAAVAGAPRAA